MGHLYHGYVKWVHPRGCFDCSIFLGMNDHVIKTKFWIVMVCTTCKNPSFMGYTRIYQLFSRMSLTSYENMAEHISMVYPFASIRPWLLSRVWWGRAAHFP